MPSSEYPVVPQHDRNPALRVATYPVAVSEGEVLVDLPDA